ncbi:hypothetical protein PQO03_02100 [Lentisphaera profundi]|uniref:Uncharacterized protein n=1 Tax=Lentisphaera profundi TaxID=1658616 RepID=A0ABY7VS76_9BACT|nr:hypothetical protein [Lentisphaera profundi]WDE96751.1 hypothetical protein PQO03_02100 [Lentisphaera profundi]
MVYLLPGMGANRAMYAEWDQSDGYCFLDWPKYSGESSLEDIATQIITRLTS